MYETASRGMLRLSSSDRNGCHHDATAGTSSAELEIRPAWTSSVRKFPIHVPACPNNCIERLEQSTTWKDHTERAVYRAFWMWYVPMG
jgi:hypothetical protein